MTVLHNRIAHEELRQLLMLEKEPRITLSFYHYFHIQHPQEFRDQFYKQFLQLKVFGRIYVAKEGINAQVSVPMSGFSSLKDFLFSFDALTDMRLNIAVANDRKSFWMLKVKLRDKIVADGINDPAFDMSKKGEYLDAMQMNELMKDESTIVVDMRNHYEYEVGHFEHALEVPSDTFRDQLPMAVDMLRGKEDKNIIMYCTGGIRCEKASAYMRHNGFKKVFHLKGGIINYARLVKELHLENKFIGKNFVFDERLGERITDDVIARCHQCGKPCDIHTNCKNDGCHLLFIQCDECAAKYEGCCSKECMDTINLPLERRKEIRRGITKGQNIFNKSKARLRPRLTDLNKTL